MDREPLRVFVTIKATSDHYSEAWMVPEYLVKLLLNALPLEASEKPHKAAAIRVLAVIRTNSKIRIAFDLFHNDYNSETAHLPGEGNLPVWQVVLNKKNGNETIETLSASKPVQDIVNEEVRRIHRSNALHTQPPFKEDYANNNTPVSLNPRCPRGTVRV